MSSKIFGWLLWCVLTVGLANTASSPPVWLSTAQIKAGTISCYPGCVSIGKLGGDSKSYYDIVATFPQAFTAVPNIIFGTNGFVMAKSTFTVVEYSITTPSLSVTTLKLRLKFNPDTSNLTTARVYYMGTETTFTNFHLENSVAYSNSKARVNLATMVKSGVGYRSAVLAMPFGTTVNLANTLKIMPIMQGVTVNRNGGSQINVTVSASPLNSSFYSVMLSTASNCSISTYLFSCLWYDQTIMATNFNVIVEAGLVSAVNSNWAGLKFTSLSWSKVNSIIALSGLTIGANLLTYTFDETTTLCTGTSPFNWLQFVYLNYQQLSCPTTFPFYFSVDGLCYNPCPAGYVGVTAASACMPCGYKCLTCSATNTSVCLTCSAANFRTLSLNTCICTTGYYDTGVAACTPCNYTCLTCSSTTTCTSCSAANFRSLLAGQCPCKSGYYDAGVGLCVSCSSISGCLACSSATVCTICSSGSISSVGTCGCGAGTYLSGSTCPLCSVAMPGCTTCTSSSSCLTCDSASFFQLVSGASNCSCFYGYYYDPILLKCSPCSVMSGCLSCLNSTTCLACNASINLAVDPVNLNCTCAVGSYSSGSTCLPCSSTIPMCSYCTSSTACTLCAAPSVVVGGLCGCGTGTYDDGFGNCIDCNLTLPGCTVCTSDTVCTNCNTTAFYGLNLTNCQCLSGYQSNGGQCVVGCTQPNQFFNGVTCVACHTSCAMCLGLGPLNCTACNSPNVLQGSQCNCPAGQYMDATFTCQFCSQLCLTCANSSTTCLTCHSPMVVSGTICVCSAGLYLPPGMTFCLPCDVACTSCTGSSNADCQSCNPTFILTGTTCACASQQYVDPTTSQCANCDYTCQTCNGTTDNDCLTCDLSRSIAGTSCPCNTGLFDIGLAVCYSSNCNVGYAPNATGVCQEICGDGFLYILPCDDGNTLSGDGCSSTCEVETNYTCQGGSPTSASICSYNQPITLKLVSTIKNLTSNIVYFTIQIYPTMPALKGLNFSSVLSCNLTGASLDYVYDSTTGLLMVAAAYTSSIQSQDVKLQFIPSVSSSSPYFFATPPSSFSFVVNPQNNLAATSLDNNVYSGVHTFDVLWQVLLYLALAGMLLAMFTSRFIGVEMVGVVQIAFIGLCMIDYLQPLISPMTKMFPINFVNSALQGTATNNSALPDRVAVLQYGVDLLYSFNYSLLLLLLPGMVSLALYIASKIRKDIYLKLREQSLEVLCDYGLSSVVFCIFHQTISLGWFMLYGSSSSDNAVIFGLSVFEALLVSVYTTSILLLFWFCPTKFGEYRTAFKPDTASQHHYYLLILERILLVGLMFLANDSKRVGYVCMVPSTFAIVYLAMKRPYLHLSNNIRAICNEAVVFAILLMYGYYRSAVSYTQHLANISNSLPYLLIFMLFACVLGNIAIMVMWKCDRVKESKLKSDSNNKHSLDKMHDYENALFVDEAKRRLEVLNVPVPELSARATIATSFKPVQDNINQPITPSRYSPIKTPLNIINEVRMRSGLKEKLIRPSRLPVVSTFENNHMINYDQFDAL